MKIRILNSIALVLVIALTVACSKDDDTSANNDTSADRVRNIAQSGDWIITYFFDTDKEETSNFNGYVFSFNSDGSLVATNGTNTVNGSWSVEDDSSSSSSDDDGSSSGDDDDFNIFFQVPASSDFEDLIDDWDIVSITDNKMELIDVSGGNGGTDLLTFEKR